MGKLKPVGALSALCRRSVDSVFIAVFGDGCAAYEKADYVTALKRCKRAATKNAARPQFTLGLMYSNGHGVVQDYAEALRWYKLSAAQNNAEAQNNIGAMYYSGQGVAQDYAAALRWFNLAAGWGNTHAEKNINIVIAKMTPQQIFDAHKVT